MAKEKTKNKEEEKSEEEESDLEETIESEEEEEEVKIDPEQFEKFTEQPQQTKALSPSLEQIESIEETPIRLERAAGFVEQEDQKEISYKNEDEKDYATDYSSNQTDYERPGEVRTQSFRETNPQAISTIPPELQQARSGTESIDNYVVKEKRLERSELRPFERKKSDYDLV